MRDARAKESWQLWFWRVRRSVAIKHNFILKEPNAPSSPLPPSPRTSHRQSGSSFDCDAPHDCPNTYTYEEGEFWLRIKYPRGPWRIYAQLMRRQPAIIKSPGRTISAESDCSGMPRGPRTTREPRMRTDEISIYFSLFFFLSLALGQGFHSNRRGGAFVVKFVYELADSYDYSGDIRAVYSREWLLSVCEIKRNLLELKFFFFFVFSCKLIF